MEKFVSKLVILFLFATILDCSSAPTPDTPEAEVNIWTHISCINQDMSDEANLTKYEQKFVIVPYKKIKTPGKEEAEKATDETDNLYFERVAKMAEKILTDAGLKKTKTIDTHTLTIALSWNTKKRNITRGDLTNFIASNKNKVALKVAQPGLLYLNYLHLKAIGSNKKTTRWDLTVESINTNTFYLNVLPPLFLVGKDYLGKNCDQQVEKSAPMNSPEINAIRDEKSI